MDEKVLAQYEKADEFVRAGNHLHAVQIYKRLLEENAEVRATVLRLAHLYEQMKLFGKVKELLEDYLSSNFDDETKILYGQFLLRIKEFERASEVFAEVDKLQYPETNYFLGIAFFEDKNYEKAVESFTEYLNTNDERYKRKALFAKAKSDFELGNYEAVLDALEILDKINGLERGKIYLLYAKTYFARGNFYYAKDTIEKARKLMPSSDEINFLSAKIHFYLQEYDEAQKYLSLLVESNFKNAEVYSLLGFIRIAKNDFEKAKEYLTYALKENPFNKNVIALKNKLLELTRVEDYES